MEVMSEYLCENMLKSLALQIQPAWLANSSRAQADSCQISVDALIGVGFFLHSHHHNCNYILM